MKCRTSIPSDCAWDLAATLQASYISPIQISRRFWSLRWSGFAWWWGVGNRASDLGTLVYLVCLQSCFCSWLLGGCWISSTPFLSRIASCVLATSPFDWCDLSGMKSLCGFLGFGFNNVLDWDNLGCHCLCRGNHLSHDDSTSILARLRQISWFAYRCPSWTVDCLQRLPRCCRFSQPRSSPTSYCLPMEYSVH